MLISAPLAAVPGVRHGFFTRRGGVSAGIYDALNCGLGSNDLPENVTRNRARCAERLGVAATDLATAYQVHGTTAVAVDMPWSPGSGPRADALVTRRRGVAIGILTADCVPILLVDRQAGVVGAAHAGWKGAKAGVAASVVQAMVEQGASPGNIVAAVGPAIGPASYEVGPEFKAGFLADASAAERFFHDGPGGRPHFDLPGFVAERLSALGLATVDTIPADTCADAERFFSYRRSCHRGETDYGRQLSAIALI